MKLKMNMEGTYPQQLSNTLIEDDDLDLLDPVGPIPKPTGPVVMPNSISKLLGGNGKKESNELQFSRFLGARNEFRSYHCGENLFLYQWTQSHWSKCSDRTGQKMAWTWLKLNSPKDAKAHAAESLFDSALLDLPALPAAPQESVIPLSNVWLVVREDGRFEVKHPDMSWGVTYRINTSLPTTKIQSFYQPGPLPEDSLFARFLRSSLPDEPERQLVQEYCGYTLLNDVRFQCCQVWVGDGRNGKSVLLKIMEQLHAKVGTLNLDDLSGFGLSALVDASLIVCPETPKRGIDEQTLKRIISGDSIAVSYKYKDAFRYSPFAKLIVACNRFPHLTDDSNGVWRRVQIVQWSVNLSKEHEIANLDQKIIQKELDLVVAWCLQGLARLLDRGDFDVPASVEMRKAGERSSSNNILAFIEDHGLQLSSCGDVTEKTVIYQRYTEFCHSHGLTAFQGNEFWKRMRGQFPAMVESKKTIRNVRARMLNLVFDVSDGEPVGEIPVFNGEQGGSHE